MFQPVPAVGIIPLGTGNDLSRVLGWGSKQSANFDIRKLLQDVQEADAVSLDRCDQ